MDGPNALDLARHGILFVTLVACLYTDLASGKIHNAVVYPAMAAGLILGLLIGGVWTPVPLFALFSPVEAGRTFCLGTSALGLAAGGGIPLVVWWRGGLGGGDVKMLAAVGALSGIGFVLPALFLTSLVGAVLAAGVLIWKGGWKKRKELTVPYGAAIAIGTLWAWWNVYGR